jgi:hypothetical protein
VQRQRQLHGDPPMHLQSRWLLPVVLLPLPLLLVLVLLVLLLLLLLLVVLLLLLLLLPPVPLRHQESGGKHHEDQ